MNRDEISKEIENLKERFLNEEITVEEYNSQRKALDFKLEKTEVEETIETKPITKIENKSNPWMYVSIFLAILLSISMLTNAIDLKKTDNLPKNDAQIPQQLVENQKAEVSADDDAFIGLSNAPITIIEFSDYQCPFCVRAEPAVKQILENYKDKVKFVYRDFPLSFHQNAQKSAEASECADEQGKFWEYHDLLFEKQSEWANDASKLKEYAKSLSLDEKKFNDCLDSGKYSDEVSKDFEDGQKVGVSGTPTFFINGIPLVGAQPFSEFQKIIDGELKK